jgi:hypothetical protein
VSGPPALEDVRDDLVVAGVAAAATVALTLATELVLAVEVGPVRRMAPLGVYLCYLLFGRGETGSPVERPLPWAGLSVLAAVAVVALAL